MLMIDMWIGELELNGLKCIWSTMILVQSTSLPLFVIKGRADGSWGNWQYQAGVGNDPRSSRQFNPIKQAADYDAEGKYVRLWIPELKDVNDMYLQTPWCKSSSLRFSDGREQKADE